MTEIIGYTDNITIYSDKEQQINLRITLADETLWLSMSQIAELFGRDKSVIFKHIKNIFDEGELIKESTIANFAIVQNEGTREVERFVEHFNLDVIISVGYRVNSKQGTKFRIWATNILKNYLLSGYTINKTRLLERNIKESEEIIGLLEKLSNNDKFLINVKFGTVIDIINKYNKTWRTLLDYDNSNLQFPKKLRTTNDVILENEQIISLINNFKNELIGKGEASKLFGIDTSNSLSRIIAGIEQTFDGKPLYKTIEEKAAHLLYFIIKDHPFIDGNKRIGTFLFIYYLNFYKLNTEINENTLIAIALMIAESDPKQKELMVKLVVNLICP
jgi:prophage maintenance system killer protein